LFAHGEFLLDLDGNRERRDACLPDLSQRSLRAARNGGDVEIRIALLRNSSATIRNCKLSVSGEMPSTLGLQPDWTAEILINRGKAVQPRSVLKVFPTCSND